MYPKENLYSKEHEWARVDEDQCTLGITHFAQDELGEVVFVELPEEGKEFKQGDVIGTIESVKAVSEIFAPMSGTVVNTNSALEDAPDTVNSDPHGGGWYCTFTASDPSEMDGLMDAAGYQELIGG